MSTMERLLKDSEPKYRTVVAVVPMHFAHGAQAAEYRGAKVFCDDGTVWTFDGNDNWTQSGKSLPGSRADQSQARG